MAFKYHDIVGIGDIHIPHDLEYANQAARLTGAGLGSQHVGRLCKQLDDGSYWVLTQFTPSITWAAFVPPEPVVGDIGSTLSVVTDGASGVKLDWTGDASVTLDDAYNNSGGASTITVDAGDVTWSPSGAYSFVVNSSSAGVGDGFEVVDGTDSFKVLHGGLNTLNLTASLASVNLDTSANFNATILGDTTWTPTGARSFIVDLSAVTGSVDGFNVVNGTDQFKLLYFGANSVQLDADLSSGDISTAAGMGISSGTVLSLIGSSSVNFATTPKLTTSAAQDLNIVPGTGGITVIGDAGSTSRGLNANDDLFVSGEFEVDGNIFSNNNIVMTSNKVFYSSTIHGGLQPRNTSQTVDAPFMLLGSSCNYMVMCEWDDNSYDFQHTIQVNPTLFIHSANQSTIRWISFTHDQSSGLIATGEGNLKFLPAGGYITQIGDAGSTSHSLAANDDLFVSGKFEVDGSAWFDGTAFFNGLAWVNDNQRILLGNPGDGAGFVYEDANQTNAALMILSGTTSESVILCQGADRTFNFAHSAQSNPTIFLHSANQSTTEWLSISHEQTYGKISTGVGFIVIEPATGYYTKIGSGTSSHSLNSPNDLFVGGKIEVDGVAFFDAGLTSGTADIQVGSDMLFRNTGGSPYGAFEPRNTNQTPNTAYLAVGAVSNSILFAQYGDRSFDFAHALQTNPTVFVHSANQSTTEWISFAHNQTDGAIDVGTGVLKFLSEVSFTDTATVISGQTLKLNDNSQLSFGNSLDSIMEFNQTDQTNDTLMLGLDVSSRSFVICDVGDRSFNFAHALQTNPTVFLHSANQATDEWLSFAHNQTDGVIATGTGNLQLLPATGNITQIGDAGSTSRGLVANDDLFVSGKLEVDGVFYLDGGLEASSPVVIRDGIDLSFGTSSDASLIYKLGQTNDSLMLGVSSDSNALIVCQNADTGFNFDHSVPSNPAIFLHSANQATDEWLSFAHNQTDAFEGIGSGSRVTEHETPVELADDGSFDLPTASAGFCSLIVGDTEEYAQFAWDSTATVTLIVNSTNVVATDTDTKFCIFDNGTSVRVRNRLGAAKKVVFDYHFTTP